MTVSGMASARNSSHSRLHTAWRLAPSAAAAGHGGAAWEGMSEHGMRRHESKSAAWALRHGGHERAWHKKGNMHEAARKGGMGEAAWEA